MEKEVEGRDNTSLSIISIPEAPEDNGILVSLYASSGVSMVVLDGIILDEDFFIDFDNDLTVLEKLLLGILDQYYGISRD